MATGFDIRDVDPEAFISDQRQGEGKGGDRGVSLQIIDDVLENSKGLFEENGLNDELAEKLKQLWISKLDAFNVGSEEHNTLVAPKTSSKKSLGSISIKNVTFSTKSSIYYPKQILVKLNGIKRLFVFRDTKQLLLECLVQYSFK